ncbi:MAG: class I SAM-dependent methyltransferase, partial [bacterium]
SRRLPLTFKLYDLFSVLPVRDHYYQPVFRVSDVPEDVWTRENPLRGVDMNIDAQLSVLKEFDYNQEIESLPPRYSKEVEEKLGFYFNNETFGSGDAEIFHNILRRFQPKKLIEIGAGFSTRLARQALERNRDEGALCEHICIEPFEQPWLEKLGPRIIRARVESLPLSTFENLEKNDILFIDSSHIVRTGGDVLFEYLELLPTLKSGVLVHVHDIFLPFEYKREWVVERKFFWTEQYLLQAFLAFNADFEVFLSLNYLANRHRNELEKACPVFSRLGERSPAPGSFWIRRK